MAPLAEPVLTLAIEKLAKLTNPDEDISAIWNVFTKCKDNLENGHRLENMSWRLWYRSCHSSKRNNTLQPLTEPMHSDVPLKIPASSLPTNYSAPKVEPCLAKSLTAFEGVISPLDIKSLTQKPNIKADNIPCIKTESSIIDNGLISNSVLQEKLPSQPIYSNNLNLPSQPTYSNNQNLPSQPIYSDNQNLSLLPAPQLFESSLIRKSERHVATFYVSSDASSECDSDISDFDSEDELTYIAPPLFSKVKTFTHGRPSLLSVGIQRCAFRNRHFAPTAPVSMELSDSLRQNIASDRAMPFNTVIGNAPYNESYHMSFGIW